MGMTTRFGQESIDRGSDKTGEGGGVVPKTLVGAGHAREKKVKKGMGVMLMLAGD